jgi:hypothetical protein
MTGEARRNLAELQASLLRSLTCSGQVPEGIDRDRAEAAGVSLSIKRARSVARAWPDLAAALGNEFGARFADFAAGTPLPARGGPLADGLNFALWLARHSPLPASARLEQLAVTLRYRSHPDGLEPRRGPALRWAWIDSPGQLVIAVRWSRHRESWLRLPLRWQSQGAG